MRAPPTTSPLLTATLADAAPREALLSPQATFLIAFFGGPWSALYVMATNFRRLGRLRQEAPVLVLGALLGLVALVVSWAAIARPELFVELGVVGRDSRPNLLVRQSNNFLGMAVWGLGYLRMRVDLRAAAILSAGFANPWGTVAIAVVLAILIHGGVAAAAFLR